MVQQLEGKITRFGANHVKNTVTFMLEGDDTIYVLKTDKYLSREMSEVLDLTQAGDDVSISFYQRRHEDYDGVLSMMSNKSLPSSQVSTFSADRL